MYNKKTLKPFFIISLMALIPLSCKVEDIKTETVKKTETSKIDNSQNVETLPIIKNSYFLSNTNVHKALFDKFNYVLNSENKFYYPNASNIPINVSDLNILGTKVIEYSNSNNKVLITEINSTKGKDGGLAFFSYQSEKGISEFTILCQITSTGEANFDVNYFVSNHQNFISAKVENANLIITQNKFNFSKKLKPAPCDLLYNFNDCVATVGRYITPQGTFSSTFGFLVALAFGFETAAGITAGCSFYSLGVYQSGNCGDVRNWGPGSH